MPLVRTEWIAVHSTNGSPAENRWQKPGKRRSRKGVGIGTRELRRAHVKQGGSQREAINRAIRAEVSGASKDIERIADEHRAGVPGKARVSG